MLNLRVGEIHLGQGLRLVPCGNTWTEKVNRGSKLFIKFLCWSCRSTRPHMERPTEQSSPQPEIHHVVDIFEKGGHLEVGVQWVGCLVPLLLVLVDFLHSGNDACLQLGGCCAAVCRSNQVKKDFVLGPRSRSRSARELEKVGNTCSLASRLFLPLLSDTISLYGLLPSTPRAWLTKSRTTNLAKEPTRGFGSFHRRRMVSFDFWTGATMPRSRAPAM